VGLPQRYLCGATDQCFFVGGTLLSLRDAAMPDPLDLKLENGPTGASLVGTVENSPMRSNGLAKSSARDFWN
jgi:hypothetical protein